MRRRWKTAAVVAVASASVFLASCNCLTNQLESPLPPPLPLDASVNIANASTLIVRPARRRVWNAIWFPASSISSEAAEGSPSQSWCVSARVNAHLDISPRCEQLFTRWGERPREELLPLPRAPELHQHDGLWAAACSLRRSGSRREQDLRVLLETAIPAQPPAKLASEWCSGKPAYQHDGNGSSSFEQPVQMGEAKTFVGPGRQRYLYGYTRRMPRDCRPKPSSISSKPAWREYWRNSYGNFICREGGSGHCAKTEGAIMLHYESSQRPEARSYIAKNFLLFVAPGTTPGGEKTLYAITLIDPHAIHEVNITTGRMQRLVLPKGPVPPPRLGFQDRIGLSAGPVPILLPDGRRQLLVAGHTRRGGVGPGTAPMRMTFFYTCDPVPPFTIRQVTPVVQFGLSDSLEYLTHIELVTEDNRGGESGGAARARDNGLIPQPQLYISLGVDDCASVLLRVPLARIIALLQPVDHRPPRKRRRRRGRKLQAVHSL